MIQCRVNLYILVFNKQSLVYEVVLNNEHGIAIPSQDLCAHTDIDSILNVTFKEYIDLDPLYTNFVLADVVNADVLQINYFCLVPYSANIKKGKLVAIKNDQIYSPTMRKIMVKL